MTWTAEKPTAPGWYWYRFPEGDKEIICVQQWAGVVKVTFSGREGGVALGEIKGEFAGPIPEPVDQTGFDVKFERPAPFPPRIDFQIEPS